MKDLRGRARRPSRAERSDKTDESTFQLRSEPMRLLFISPDHAAQRDALPHLNQLLAITSIEISNHDKITQFFNTSSAARKPPIPCTPAPGGVAAEQMKISDAGVR